MRVKKFTKGELISAARLNELIAGINSSELHAGSGISLFRSRGGTTINAFERNQGVPFYNNSGSTCPAYGVMGLTGIALGTGMPFYFTAEQPGTTFRRYFIVNGPESVAASATGVGYIVNGSQNRVCVAAYDSGSPAAGEEWGVKPSQFTLSKGYPGCFTVLGILDSTNKWMLGYLHPIDRFVAKCNAAIAADATSGVVKPCQGAGGSETAIPSMTVSSVTNRHGLSLLTDDICYVEYFEGVPYIVNARTKAKWIDFSVTTSAFTQSTASIASQTVNDYWGGYDPGGTVTIYNKASTGPGSYIFHGPVGAKGRACLDDLDDKYRIVSLEGYAKFVQGTLSGALAGTGTLTVSNYWDGCNPGSSVTVQNINSVFTGAGGEDAQATYDPANNNYVLTWVSC